MNDTYEITAVGHGGVGITRIDGAVCFVPYGLPGDVVKLYEVQRRRGVLWARIAEVVAPGEARMATDCAAFGLCGGCTWLHFAYPAQAEWKQRIVGDSFKRLAKLDVEPTWVEDASLRLGYRTRAEFHGDGKRLGFYEEFTHRIVDIEACPLCHPRLNEALAQLRAAKPVGSVELVVNPEGEDVLACTRDAIEAVRKCFPGVCSPRDRERSQFVFDGRPIVAGAFSQSSLLLNRPLCQLVARLVGGAQRVLDLYCGNGNLSMPFAAEVVGLDHNTAAVEAAAKLRAGYREGDENAMRRAIGEGSWEAVILDPPRTGAKELTKALAQATGVASIVYVSCEPATLARDARTLVDAGWRIDSLHAIDLFPHTAHVEAVCHFAR